MAVAAVMLILPVPVPAVVVNPVGCALFHAVAVAFVTVTVPPLKVKFFVPASVMNEFTESVWPLRFNVPVVSVRVLEVVHASTSCTVLDTVLITTAGVNVLPFEVTD